MGLTERERRVLEVLSEDGGFYAVDVAERCPGHFPEDRRSASAECRKVLSMLRSRGLAKPLDDLKPVAWCRSPEGSEAVGQGASSVPDDA